MTDEELIDGYFHDQLSPEEVAKLEDRLKADQSVRERYRRYGEMVYGMETLSRTGEAGQSSLSDGRRDQPKVLRLLAPWTQIAAACVITAIFVSSASAWYAERKQATRVERVDLLDESFESSDREVVVRPSPLEPGGWRVDGSVIGSGPELPAAADGNRYVRLEPHHKRKLSYLDGVIDLREAQKARAEKGAKRVRMFCRVALRPERLVRKEWVHYRLRVATFESAPEHTAEQWRLGPPQFYGATYSHRAVRVNTGREQWHVLETTVDVPEDVQSMMLSVSASANGEFRGNHLVDAIEADLIFEYEID